ncbi:MULTISPECIES: helix-turn-helix domain-containing protein [Clostridium]|uniref:helix-turn-helix domain-containing protein n=1 Tax=Clostridium TaxID=1485 RepID=UPI000825584B|nr:MULTISPECIES: helix-turn-helix transcriptional regulator [Clostridium]PJI09339.1 XRE family transcriptional regulator [Clostridium sp. CT7]
MGSYEILSIGTKLKNLREKYNVKQEDISGKEITRNLISQIEHGKANLTKNAAEIILKNLKRICDKNHITIDENIEYLMEDEKSQANRILDKYIKELKDLFIYKDTSFINKLNDAEKFLMKWNFTDKKTSIFELAGDYFASIEDYYKSSLYYEKARALLDMYSNNSLSILRKLSMVYFYVGNYEQNIKCCEFALDWFKDMNEEYRCIFLFNSTLCYDELKEYDKALRNLNILEPIIKDVNVDKYYDVLLQEAICLQHKKEYDKSLEIYNYILKIFSSKNIENYVLALIDMTQIYIDLNKPDIVKKHLNSIVSMIVNLNSSCKHYPGIHCEIGKIYKSLNDLNSAEEYLLKSLTLAKKQIYFYVLKNSISELIDIYLQKKDTEKLSNIKNEFFILTSIHNKIDNSILLKLIEAYLKVEDTRSQQEVINFCKKFNKEV